MKGAIGKREKREKFGWWHSWDSNHREKNLNLKNERKGRWSVQRLWFLLKMAKKEERGIDSYRLRFRYITYNLGEKDRVFLCVNVFHARSIIAWSFEWIPCVCNPPYNRADIGLLPFADRPQIFNKTFSRRDFHWEIKAIFLFRNIKDLKIPSFLLN